MNPQPTNKQLLCPSCGCKTFAQTITGTNIWRADSVGSASVINVEIEGAETICCTNCESLYEAGAFIEQGKFVVPDNQPSGGGIFKEYERFPER